jgi:hypothetical protein
VLGCREAGQLAAGVQPTPSIAPRSSHARTNPDPAAPAPPELLSERKSQSSRLGALDKVLRLYQSVLGLELVPGDGGWPSGRGAGRRAVG